MRLAGPVRVRPEPEDAMMGSTKVVWGVPRVARPRRPQGLGQPPLKAATKYPFHNPASACPRPQQGRQGLGQGPPAPPPSQRHAVTRASRLEGEGLVKGAEGQGKPSSLAMSQLGGVLASHRAHFAVHAVMSVGAVGSVGVCGGQH